MFGPSGKLYRPPSFRLRLLERQQGEDLAPEEAQALAEAMARVNEEKRQPKSRRDQTTV
jgi:hypothetical protein